MTSRRAPAARRVRVAGLGYNVRTGGSEERAMTEDGLRDDALLDLGRKSNEELRALLDELYAEEQRVSYRRRVLHGKIDILRAELVSRLKAQRESGGDVISGTDVERLIDILDPSSKTIDALMRLSLAAGVDIEIKM